jgi:hypothetical protein
MPSNAKKTKSIRSRKAKPNKANQKADLQRVQRNAKRLKDLASEDET